MQNDEYPPELIRSFEVRLSVMDQAFQTLAMITGGAISIYDQEFPIRAVQFSEGDGLVKSVFLQPGSPLTTNDTGERTYGFILAMSAWKDEPSGRWDWHRKKCHLERLPERFPEQLALLEECLEELRTVSLEDLTFEPVPGRPG